MKKAFFTYLLGLGLAFLIILLTPLNNLDLWLFDTYQMLFPKINNDDIVIFGIDERSYEYFNMQYPLDRKIYGEAIGILNECGAKFIGIDLLFDLPSKEDSDKFLRASIAENVFFGTRVFSKEEFVFFKPHQIIGEVKLGFTENFMDVDGIVRRYLPYFELNGSLYPSFAQVIFNPEKKIKKPQKIAFLKNWREEIPILPFSRIFKDNKEYLEEIIKGKIVLIGTTDPLLHDIVRIPHTSNLFSEIKEMCPGVVFQAQAILNAKENYPLKEIPEIVFFLIFIIIPFSLFLIRRKVALKGGIVFSILFFAFLLLISFIIYRFLNLLLPPISLYIPYLSYAVLLTIKSYYKTERKSRYLKEAFSQYVSPHIVKEIIRNPGKVNLSGEKKFVTVLNLDIRGFTSMVANLSAETSVHMLNEFFSIWVPEIIERDGTLDKFTGDGLMAIFGAPLNIEDCYDRAVEAAFAILERTKEKWEELKKKTKNLPEEIKIGIGLSSGEVIAGNLGCQRHKEYTVIGNPANLASRLQELTKEYKKDIIIDLVTYQLTKYKERFSFIEEVKVRGFENRFAIYSNIN